MLQSIPTQQCPSTTALQLPFINDVSQWLQAGKLKYKEDVVKGLEKAPNAFIGLERMVSSQTKLIT